MTKYLLDTNVVLRYSNPLDAQHEQVLTAIELLLSRGDECLLTGQVLIEFWVVATRPVNVNGFGWSVAQTAATIEQLLDQFPLVEETEIVFSLWLNLVAEYRVMGKRSHDARIIAVMIAAGISHILTLNPKDFLGFSEVKIVHPQEIVEG